MAEAGNELAFLSPRLRQAAAEAARCAAAPRCAMEVRLQVDQIDQPFQLQRSAAEVILGSLAGVRVRLLGQRQSAGAASALEPGERGGHRHQSSSRPCCSTATVNMSPSHVWRARKGAAVRLKPLPRRPVHRHDTPAVPHAGAVDVVDPRDRAVFHRECETRFRIETERQPERCADRAAVRHRDDVVTGIGSSRTRWIALAPPAASHRQSSRRPVRARMRRRMPEPVKRAAAPVVGVRRRSSPSVTELLLGEVRDRRCTQGPGVLGRSGQARADDRPRRFMGAAQIAGNPDRLAR